MHQNMEVMMSVRTKNNAAAITVRMILDALDLSFALFIGINNITTRGARFMLFY